MLFRNDVCPMPTERTHVSPKSYRRQDASSQSQLEFHKSMRQIHRFEGFAVVATTTG